jgi:FtsH-binding integral membrane protein
VIVLTILAAAAAAAGWLIALSLFRATSDDDLEGAPPGGRTRFMAAVGLAIAPIFLAIILLNGIGAVVQSCGQS